MQLRSRGTQELFELADGMTVGRMADCAVRVEDGSISRHHASFEEVGGVLFLVDNGSSNGCFRNGERVSRCVLRVGDLLTLGAVAFDVLGADASPSVPLPPSAAAAPIAYAAAESAAPSVPSRAAEAAATRAHLRREMTGNHRSRGLGDLGQQPLGVKILLGIFGVAVMYGVILGIRLLAAAL
jgi:hypothetical protein